MVPESFMFKSSSLLLNYEMILENVNASVDMNKIMVVTTYRMSQPQSVTTWAKFP